MPSRRSRGIVALAAAALATLPAAACGSDDAAPRPSVSVAPMPDDGGVVQSGVHNAQDAAFASDMIIHHRQALTMAQLAPGRSRNDKVLALAARIKENQTPEVQQLARLLAEWGKPVPAPSATPVGHTLPGAVSTADLRSLRAAQGDAFDRAFLTLMIKHHQGAVAQAQDQVRTGADERARGLAEDIVISQSAEVDEMRTLLG